MRDPNILGGLKMAREEGVADVVGKPLRVKRATGVECDDSYGYSEQCAGHSHLIWEGKRG